MTKAQIEAHWFLWKILLQDDDPSAEEWDAHYLSLADADDADDADKKYYKEIVFEHGLNH